MDQTEIDELRRMHEAATPGDWEATGWEAGSHGHKHDTCCIAVKGSQTFLTGNIPETPRRRATHKFIAAARNALPRLLAALEEARAERDKANLRERNIFASIRIALGEDLGGGGGLVEILNGIEELQEQRDALKAKMAAMDLLLNNAERVVRDGIADRDAAETQAWDALGRPEGTHDTSNVQRLCEAHGALKAKLAHAEAEAAGYQKLAQACKDEDGKTVVVIIQGESEVRVFGPNSDCEERFGEVVVRWWKLLDTVVESKAFDALKAERDALKATLAKHAESERAWCELATARGEKLAALATACSTWQEWGGHCDTCEFVRQRAANTILDTALFADYCDCGWHATREALAAAKEQP